MADMNRARRVRVHIERIVVDGAADLRGERLSEAIVDELTWRLVNGPSPAEERGELTVELDRAPEAAGRTIAAALHARLITRVRDG